MAAGAAAQRGERLLVVGFGDELIGSGLARGAHARGKRIAFGDGKRIIWSHHCHEIFRGNPNVAPPGSEKSADLEWIPHYGGHRLYGSFSGGRWRWKDFKCIPGQIYFEPQELQFSQPIGEVIIEPRVKRDKVNKLWPTERYQKVADELMRRGFSCSQLVPPKEKPLLRGVSVVNTETFRRAVAAMSRIRLFIGAEGGLHHGAAAMGAKAVVIFGGFIGPNTTGYDWHHNIAVGPPCGSGVACVHCKKILQSISAEQVLEAALDQLEARHVTKVSCQAE